MKDLHSMGDRLRALIDYTNMKDKDFGLKFGASPTQISDWLAGKRISMNKLSDMLDAFPEFNAHWFLTGHCNMINSDELQDIDSEKQQLKISKNKESDCQEIINRLQKDSIKLKEIIIQLQQEKIEWLEKDKINDT